MEMPVFTDDHGSNTKIFADVVSITQLFVKRFPNASESIDTLN